MAILHERVTGRFALLVEDMVQDVDHQLDEVNLSGGVTFSPVFPKGVTHGRDAQPSRIVSLKPIRSMVADGELVSLSGTGNEIGEVEGDAGQELPAFIGDMPVWWRATFDVKYNDRSVPIPSMLVDLTDGPVDLSTLLETSGFPEAPMDDVYGIIATVREMSRAAERAIAEATAAAEKVGEVDEAARDAVERAGSSADGAAESARVASEGADRVGSAERVLDAERSAAASAVRADGRAEDAESSAVTAKGHLDATLSARQQTGQSRDEARTARNDAQASAKDAAASQDAADGDAKQTADDRRQTGEDRAQAFTHRTNAGSSATNAANSRDAAAQSAADASTSATAAKSDADRAESAADSADGAAVEAVTERVNTLLDGAPAAYDTLAEVAAKLSDQDDVASALTSQIGEKVSQTSLGKRLYGTNTSGAQETLQYSSDPDGGTIPYRTTGGQVRTAAPSDAAHAATKQYVDDAANRKLDAAKIQVVAALPSNPDPNTIYMVTGE